MAKGLVSTARVEVNLCRMRSEKRIPIVKGLEEGIEDRGVPIVRKPRVYMNSQEKIQAGICRDGVKEKRED